MLQAEENFVRLIASADAMAYGSSFGDFSANNEFKKVFKALLRWLSDCVTVG